MRSPTFQSGSLALVALAAGVVVATAGPCLGQPDPPDFGIDWVTVGAVNNGGYDGPDPGEWLTGRGSVGYEYRIGRTEVTTAQWMAYVNTFSTQSDDLAGFGAPSHWGATHDTSYQGPGLRWTLPPGNPDAGMQPVFGVSWRMGAQYCNWLHNGGGSDLAALDDGAYDTSTFTKNPDGTWNDQRMRHPDARYWIPSLDEWLKAAHYDPNRFCGGGEGWWLYSHRSDVQAVPGPPGEGETSAGFRFEGDPFGHLDIPLGAYPQTLSPWGLLDITGGTTEWTEETFEEVYGEFRWRIVDGEDAGSFTLNLDHSGSVGASFPFAQGHHGLRVATVAPSPSAVVLVFVVTAYRASVRRRNSRC